MLNKYLVVLVSFAVLILLQKCILGELYEGSRCVNTKNNKQHGTCKYLNDCPSALTLLRKKVYPQNCAFNKTNPIVCCFQTGSSALTNARNAGEISRQKCKEYNDNIKKQLEDFSTIAVAGGSLATKDQFPHMAAVGYKPKEQDEIQWSCGGSIISERFVLTAAHCLETKDLGTAKFILIGVIYLPDSVSGTQFNIKRAIPHPNYNSEAHYNDIALFELDKKIDISPSKRPVCLHTEHRIEEKNAIASGFGKLEFVQSTNSDHLYQVELEIYNRDECNKNYRNIPKLPNGIRDDVMVCAGHRTQFKDTCQGDSGGPLQICKKRTNNVCNNYEIIGVVSFGKACGLALNLPGVYTRVSGYTKWIEDNVWPN